MARTKNGLRIVDRLTGDDVELRRLVQEEVVNAQVAQLIYRARTEAGLTQKQLAALVGTTQPLIARLEDSDYQGNALAMLQRIAAALEQRIEIRLKPQAARRRSA